MKALGGYKSRLLGILSCALLLTGCITPPPVEPFSKFSQAIAAVGSASSDSLTALQAKSKERFLAQSADAKPETLLALSLRPDPNDPFVVLPSRTIVHLKLARLRLGLTSINEAMRDYSTKLVELASPELVNEKDIDNWTTDLNQNLRSAATALGADNAATNESAVFATIAGEAFKVYIRTKQRSELIAAMTQHQPQIVAVAEKGKHSVQIMAAEFRNVYADDYRQIILPLSNNPNPSGQEKRDVAKKLADLNEEYETRLSTLHEIYGAYGELPTAHAQLIQGMKSQTFDLGAVLQLTERALRLRAFYEELHAAPKPTGGNG